MFSQDPETKKASYSIIDELESDDDGSQLTCATMMLYVRRDNGQAKYLGKASSDCGYSGQALFLMDSPGKICH